MNDFHKTPMGRKFYDLDIPEIVKGLKKTVETLDKRIIVMEDIARELRDKRVYSASSKDLDSPLIGSTLPNESIVIFKGEFINCPVMISRFTRLSDQRDGLVEQYYVYISNSQLISPSPDGDYGSLIECFEAIVQDLS